MAGGVDDLLNPEEIEALLQAASAGPSSSPPSSPASPAPHQASVPSAGSDTLLDPAEIDALLQQHASVPTPPKPSGSPAKSSSAASAAGRAGATERLLAQAEEDLAAALAPALDRGHRPPPNLDNARPFSLQSFDNGPVHAASLPLDALQEVELDLAIELGRTELLIEEVLQLREGSVVPLDKLAGDPVDIVVNGRLVARGEVLVLNDNLCVRVAEILSPDL